MQLKLASVSTEVQRVKMRSRQLADSDRQKVVLTKNTTIFKLGGVITKP